MKHKITMQFDDFMRVVHENARVRAENIAISKQNMEAEQMRPRLDPNKSIQFRVYNTQELCVMDTTVKPVEHGQGFIITLPGPFETHGISRVCFHQDEYNFIQMEFAK